MLSALLSANLGFIVLTSDPWLPSIGSKGRCRHRSKHPIAPLFPHGHKSATTNRAKIRRAVRKHPDANLAIVPSGELFVLDVDGDLGRATFGSLNLPPTATVTSSRGFHAYYRKEGSFPAQPPKLVGIDIKAGGTGYIIVPPSIHPVVTNTPGMTRISLLLRCDVSRFVLAPPPHDRLPVVSL